MHCYILHNQQGYSHQSGLEVDRLAVAPGVVAAPGMVVVPGSWDDSGSRKGGCSWNGGG